MKLSLREAFALEPTVTVKVGGRDYTVPPLTFGRLDELLRAVRVSDLSAIQDFKFDMAGATPEAIGRMLAHYPTEAFANVAAAAIPGMTAAEWEENGDPYTLLELVGFFARSHDWPFISEHLFGKKDGDDAAPDVTLETALVLLARHLGCIVPELIDFRVEGFFACVDAMKEKRRLDEQASERAQREADGWEGPRPVDEAVPIVKDPAKSANLDRLIAEAEARKAQEAPGG